MSSVTIVSSNSSSLQSQVNTRSTNPNIRIEIESLYQTTLEREYTITNESMKNTDINGEKQHNIDDDSLLLKTSFTAWLLLVFVVLLRAAGHIFNSTFSPVPSIFADYMGISLTSINGLFIASTTVSFISCFFTSWLYQSIGVKRSLVLSGFILSLGCWIRWIATKINPPSFPTLVLGQVIASFGPPIMRNIMTTFATLWFTENRRATVAAIILPCPGLLIAVLGIPKITTGTDKIELTVMLVACIATACAIPMMFFPSKPRTPTSYDLSRKTDDTPQPTLREGAILLLKNTQFLILIVVMGLNYGLNSAWDTLLNQAITPYGYLNSQVGAIAAVGILAQTTGFFISGPVLDQSKQHIILLRILTPLMFSAFVAFIFLVDIFTVKADSFAAILYANLLYQILYGFVTSICVDMSVEVSHPLPESLSSSILWQSTQLFSVVFVFTMDLLRDPDGIPKNNMHKALIFQAVFGCVCLVFALAFNGSMERTQATRERENAIAKLKANESSVSESVK